MEEVLYVWFRQLQARDLAINADMLKEKAREFGKQTGVAEDFGYSPGWLHNFKKRYGIKSCVLHGESGDANREGIQLAGSNLRLLREEYTAEDRHILATAANSHPGHRKESWARKGKGASDSVTHVQRCRD
jgi:hypothetical protein